ncbi:MAG: reverse transcriptase-like protein [Bacteroidetes bacterium]|nr:reverse transcriptase-like protein [Bacteroidota bacterium]
MIHAYVDGSWMAGRTGYGAVVLDGAGKILAQFCGPVPDEYADGTRQVAGELVATGKVVQWALDQGVPELTLYYDYMGIAEWAQGTWKAKQPLTQRYRDFMQKARARLRVHYVKVKAHTGDKWNEYADQLAKKGAGA